MQRTACITLRVPPCGICLAAPSCAPRLNVRHAVKPGMTGWAAVNGWRGDTNLNERIRFDLDYIERWSLLFDAYIMLLTFSRNKNAY
jgi:lipopolysaccharide/colanic/teichoic acid biosynthesis glycosyltransferase